MLTLLSVLAAAPIAAALILTGAAEGAEIRVMISGGLSVAYRELVPEFERATGNKITTAFGPSMGTTQNAIPVRLARGEPADVLIMVGYALAICRACCSSNLTGLLYPSAEWRRLAL